LDERFNPDEIAAIERAIFAWNESLNGQMRLEVADPHYHIGEAEPGLLIIKTSQKEKIANSEDVLTALGWTTFWRSRIYLVVDRLIVRDSERGIETPWRMQDIKEIMMHELGHAMGAEHINYHGLMRDNYDEADYACIDLPTISQVAKHHRLDLSKMKWCQH
jgi:hypothetical protein